MVRFRVRKCTLFVLEGTGRRGLLHSRTRRVFNRPRVGHGNSAHGCRSGPDAAKRKRFQATQHDAIAKAWPLVEKIDLREAFEQCLQDDPAFETRQRGAQAMMDTASECQVVSFSALEIEPVRVLKNIRIPVGRAEQDDDVLALTQRETVGDYIRKCREFRLMGYNSDHERPRNYPVQSQAVQGWNPAVGPGEVHPESAVQRCTGGTQDGLGIRATRRDPVRSDEGVDLPEEGRSGGARVGGGQSGAWDVDAVGPGLQGVLPSLQGGGEAGVSSIPAHCEDGDHRRRRPEGDPGEEARSGLRHPAQGLPDDPDLSVPAVAGRMPVESVADCPQAEPGVCGPDLRGGEAAATEMRVFGRDRPGRPQASGAVHG